MQYRTYRIHIGADIGKNPDIGGGNKGGGDDDECTYVLRDGGEEDEQNSRRRMPFERDQVKGDS